ncbi:MAG: hypothetical protein EAZ97_04865 [Bacteroidetes bacterium]|nr:MAG: hypothetical protein EAZ97_04865 [Bacteroidota bacterium]
MCKKTIFLVLFLAFSLNLWAQDSTKTNTNRVFTANNNTQSDAPPNWKDNVFFGGNFWVQIAAGSVGTTFIDISPLVGYKLSPNFRAGAGVTYRYLSQTIFPYPSYTASIYGGRAFMQYYPAPTLFGHIEFESLNARVPTLAGSGTFLEMGREFIPSLLVGGGYTQSMGAKLGLNLTILYNVMYDNLKSPYIYPSPWVIRMGFVY